MRIRDASPDDAVALLDIYRYYVENTAITFEYDTPTPEEFRARIVNTISHYPYLVAEKDGEILGYAYAGPFHSRAAYSRCCELSIYLRRDARRQGLGRLLYDALEERLGAMGFLNLYACIGSPAVEDEYLNRDSERFHRRMGFILAGTFRLCGFKFGRWYNMIWMEKLIGEHRPGQ